MHSIRRSCQSALSAPSTFRPLANGSRRAFSRSSPCQRGALPQFLEPSTPELSALLSNLNSKALLPEHLNKEQRDLVYKKENRARLEAEPIEITLGNVTLPLEHIDRNRDRPNRWTTIKNVVEQSKTPEDWENVVRMMEGFNDAGVRLDKQWLEKIVRRMNEAGMQHLVLKAVQRAGHTGLRLNRQGVVHQVFKGLHDKAFASRWDEAETKKALSFAEQMVELMESEEHLGKVDVGPHDLRTSPYVIAWVAELAAVRAKKHTGSEDTDGKVKKYANRLTNALHQNEFNTNALPRKLSQMAIPPNTMKPHEKSAAMARLKRDMFDLIPLWVALRTSNQVLGEAMPMAKEAQTIEKDIREALRRGQKALQDEVDGGFKENIAFVSSTIDICEQI